MWVWTPSISREDAITEGLNDMAHEMWIVTVEVSNSNADILSLSQWERDGEFAHYMTLSATDRMEQFGETYEQAHWIY